MTGRHGSRRPAGAARRPPAWRTVGLAPPGNRRCEARPGGERALDPRRGGGGDRRGEPGDWAATGVSIDTRSLRAGRSLRRAARRRATATTSSPRRWRAGAAAALVSRRPDGVAADAPLLVVPDVLDGAARARRAPRGRGSAGRVVAVTGSVGKTGTKEMLRAALGAQGSVHAAEKSFNNHWGVPLTLARMPAGPRLRGDRDRHERARARSRRWRGWRGRMWR